MRPITFEQAKAQYVHRYTMEHVPAWAREINPGNGKYYAPGYSTDLEWYENTEFKGEGQIVEKTHSYASVSRIVR